MPQNRLQKSTWWCSHLCISLWWLYSSDHTHNELWTMAKGFCFCFIWNTMIAVQYLCMCMCMCVCCSFCFQVVMQLFLCDHRLLTYLLYPKAHFDTLHEAPVQEAWLHEISTYILLNQMYWQRCLRSLLWLCSFFYATKVFFFTFVMIAACYSWFGVFFLWVIFPGLDLSFTFICLSRSEERRVGKECVSTCKFRMLWST